MPPQVTVGVLPVLSHELKKTLNIIIACTIFKRKIAHVAQQDEAVIIKLFLWYLLSTKTKTSKVLLVNQT